eukprot:c11737_g1_i2 orf=111-1148(+)
MGNANAKDGVQDDGAKDGVGFTGDGVWASEEARVKCSVLNGQSALHGVADMIAQPPFPFANTNVVSRYQQISGQAGRGAENRGCSFLDGMHARAGVMESSSSAAVSSSIATSHPPSIIATQAALWAGDELRQSWLHPSQKNEEFQVQSQVATLIEWKYGGSDVFLEGSWDDWHTRVPLQRIGKDFALLKFLPEGVYHYKFLVDGEWRHAPDLPCMFDEKGNGINILDVQDCSPENLDGIVDFEAPASPKSSYDSPFPGPEDYSKDPPLLPSQLHHNSELEQAYQHPISSSIAGSSISSTRPQHVVLNHLFVETRKAASSPVLTLGFTQRFRSKYMTVILHKPVRR